jgi:hypothetical protein
MLGDQHRVLGHGIEIPGVAGEPTEPGEGHPDVRHVDVLGEGILNMELDPSIRLYPVTSVDHGLIPLLSISFSRSSK